MEFQADYWPLQVSYQLQINSRIVYLCVCVCVCVCVCHLFSVEQKKETQGLRFFLSEDGGRYMASEKQVRSSFSSSVLKTQANKNRIYILQ